jgi:hypothetical protein
MVNQVQSVGNVKLGKKEIVELMGNSGEVKRRAVPGYKKVILTLNLALLAIGLGVAWLPLRAITSNPAWAGQRESGVFVDGPAQALTLTMQLSLPMVVWLGEIENDGIPFATKSRYMATAEWGELFNMGCADGQVSPSDENTAVILDFGQPWSSGGAYGTLLFKVYQFRSTTQIAEGVKGYLDGFYICAPEGAHTRVAVGTNNYGMWTTYEHGMAWAEMVNGLNEWIAEQPGYESKVAVRGASDMEPGFREPVSTRAWVNGYNAAYSGESWLYNFGSCDGCPYTACPTCISPNGWTREDVWYVSYGPAANWPFPEIYLNSGIHADQWYRMSVYSHDYHGGRMHFLGTLTQWQACQTHGPCNGTDNTPEEGWSQLQEKVNSDVRTEQPIIYSSDISWPP